MNLYKFHQKPTELDHHHAASEKVPKLAWTKYEHDEDELKRREDLWAKDARYAFKYAYAIQRPFHKGEAAIAKNAEYSYLYAKEVLKKPFPKGEEAIAKDPFNAYYYACYVIKKPWPKGEAAIAKSVYYKQEYETHFKVKL